MAMSDVLGRVASIAISYFRRNNLLSLAAILNHTADEILVLPDAEAIAVCRNIRKVLNDNLLVLASYNIDAMTISILDKAINDFDGKQEDPKHAIDAREAATDSLTPLINDVELTLVNTDGLIHNWDNIDKDMVSLYFVNRKRDDFGKHHTGFEGEALGSNDRGVADVKIYDATTGELLAVSNPDGHFEKSIIKPGLRTLKIVYPGQPDQVIVVTLIRGKVFHFKIVLNISGIGPIHTVTG